MTTYGYGNLLRTIGPAALIDHINAHPPRVAYSLKKFGAIGDGLTDDTDAYLEAVAAAIDEGFRLWIPPGDFVIADAPTIDGPVFIEGEGRASRLVVDTAADRFIPVLSQSADGSAIAGVVLRHFTVDGANKGLLDSGLVQLNNVVAFVVDDLYLVNGGTADESASAGVNGISVSAGSLVATGEPVGTISNCEIAHCTKGAINATTGVDGLLVLGNYIHDMTGNSETPGIQVNGAPSTRVIGNIVRDVEGVGIIVATVGGPSYGFARYPERTIVAHNDIRRSGTGAAAGAGISVVNGVGQDSDTRGRVLVTGNMLTGGGGGIASPGVLAQNQDDVTVERNSIDGFDASGVVVQNCRRWSVSRNHITRCNLANQSTGSGVYVATSGTSVTTDGVIEGNQIHNTTGEGSGHHKYPVYIEPAAANTITGLVIRDNVTTGNETYQFPAGTWPRKLTLRQTAAVESTSATPATLVAATLEDGTLARVQVDVTAAKTGAADVADYSIRVPVKRAGAATALQGAVVALHTAVESDATWVGPDITAVSTSAVVTFGGKAATTIDAAVTLTVQTA